MLFRKKTKFEKMRDSSLAILKSSLKNADGKQIAVYTGLVLITLLNLRGRFMR
jgi:hypothetical protein